MAVLVYATGDDLAAWTGTAAPANATVLLRSASLLVRGVTKACFYDVDPDGYPTDVDTAAAFRDACCAQAAQWAALGVDPTAGAGQITKGAATSSGIGTAKITRGGESTIAANARATASTTLCAEAVQILSDAGLTPVSPYVYG